MGTFFILLEPQHHSYAQLMSVFPPLLRNGTNQKKTFIDFHHYIYLLKSISTSSAFLPVLADELPIFLSKAGCFTCHQMPSLFVYSRTFQKFSPLFLTLPFFSFFNGSFQQAYKKKYLDYTSLNNYHSISLLPFAANLLKSILCIHCHKFVSFPFLLKPWQQVFAITAWKPHYITLTPVVNIQNI